MGFMRSLLSAMALGVVLVSQTWADTPSEISHPSAMWQCPQADGSSMYTNKERAGCQRMVLKELSVVPSLEHMPTAPRPMPADMSRYELPSYQDRTKEATGKNVPDWARDWHASVAQGGSVQEEVCALYSEWMHLVQKTRGGFFHGFDSSYGGDVTGRNQRGPSNSFYDNTRYVALSKLFGTGFVPVNCQ